MVGDIHYLCPAIRLYENINPCSLALPIKQHPVANGSPLHLDRVFYMEKIKRKYHGMSHTPLHKLWSNTKNKCNNKKNKDYKYYGARGITVCDEWKNDFMAFYNWCINNGYRNGLTIDRINNDGNYEPGNCRFTTRFKQLENTRLIRENNTSGYRCVFWHEHTKKWMVSIGHNGKSEYVGIYDTKNKAAEVYNNWVITHGTDHPLNIIHNA